MKNIVTLDDVCKVKASKIIQKSLINLKGIYPVYGATGFIKNVDFYEQDEEYIAIVKDGAGIGKTMLLPKKSSILSTMQYILPKENIDIKYLYYAISYMDLRKYFTGATIPHIYFKDYKKEKLSLPNKQEQRNIVSKLISIDKLIELKKQQIIILNKLVSSLFMEMFNDPIKNNMNWEVQKLKNLCIKIGSGATPKGGQSVYIDKGTSFIRSMNVYNGYFKYDGLAHINETHAKQLENVALEENDILLNITGASVARSCIIPKNLLPARVNQHVALIRVNKEIINPIFLNHVFITDSFQKYLLNISTSNGATRQAITKQQIEDFTIILPSSKLVDLYIKKISQIDKSKLAIQQSLEKLEILKKSLMQEYFG